MRFSTISIISTLSAVVSTLAAPNSGIKIETVTEYRHRNSSSSTTTPHVAVTTVTEYKCPKKASSSTTSTSPTNTYIQQPTLQPAVVKGSHLNNPNNLKPKKQHSFYYASDPSEGVQDGAATVPVADVALNFTHHAVALEHSNYIHSVTCVNDDDLTIVFNTKEAYDIAKKNWPKSGEDFMIVSYSYGCGDHHKGERTFNKVLKIDWTDSSMTVACIVQVVGMNEAVTGGKVQWGQFTPAKEDGPPPSKVPYFGVGVGSSSDGTCPAPNSFDAKLDQALGYSTLKDANTKAQALPYLRTSSRLRRARRNSSMLGKRCWFCWFDDIVNAVVDVVKTVVNVVVSAWDAVGGIIADIGDAIVTAGELIINGEADFTPLNTKLQFAYPDPNNAVPARIQTPFGKPGYLIDGDNSTGFAAYCVDCGISGSLQFSGHVHFSVSDGLTAASLNFNGNLHAGLEIGIAFDKQITRNLTKDIFNYPLGGIVIPKIFTFGPAIKFQSDFVLGFSAKGRVLAGATLDWNPQSSINLLSIDDSTSSGWTPTLTPVMMLDGQVAVSASLGLPISFGITLDVLDGSFTKSISLVDRPSLTLTADVGVHADLNSSFGIESVIGNLKCQDAIALSLDFKNEIYVDIVDLQKFPINTFSTNVLGKCIPLGIDAPPTTTSSSSPLASSTIVADVLSSSNTTMTSSSTSASSISTSSMNITSSSTSSQSSTITASNTISSMSITSTPTTLALSSISNMTSSYPTMTAQNYTITTSTSMTTSNSTSLTSTALTITSTLNSTSPMNETISTSSCLNETSSMTITSSSNTFSSFDSTTITSTSDSISATSTGVTSTTSTIISTTNDPWSTLSITTTTNITSTSTVTSTSTDISGNMTITTFTSTTIMPSTTTYLTTSSASSTKIAKRSAVAQPSSTQTTVSIKDVKQTDLFLATSPDGSILLDSNTRSCSNPATFFASRGIVASDSSSRLLHFYRIEMETYGVSRFRLHDPEHIPNTAIIVALTSLENGNVVAIEPGSTGDAAYYPIACQIEGQPTKLFLAEDAKDGVATLKQEMMKDVLVGGKVVDCSLKNLRIM